MSRCFALIALLPAILAPSLLRAADFTWDATGADTDLGNGLNWVGGAAPFMDAGSTDTIRFSASTNTAITARDVATGDFFAGITFDASAPAYTFTSHVNNPGNDIEITSGGVLTNNSAHTQTFNTADLALLGATLDAAGGDAGTNLSYEIASLYASGTSRLTGAFDTRVTGALIGPGTLQKFGAGTLFLDGASTANLIVSIGSATGSDTGPFGAVRISTDTALGAVGSGSSRFTRIYGNTNSDGRLELTNNITVGETILMHGRQGLASAVPAILNDSGNNVLNGIIEPQDGGTEYNFGSRTGKLTIASNIDWSQAGDAVVHWFGDGDGEFAGNLTGSGANNSHPLIKQGAGTLILSGGGHSRVGQLVVRGGTLKIASTAGLSFAQTSGTSDSGGTQPIPVRVHIDTSATFDVAEISGGFILSDGQTLQGKGVVNGSVAASGGVTVRPGGALDRSIAWVYADDVGRLTVTGDLNMSTLPASANLVWQLGALSTSGAGTNFDQLVVGGNVTLGGSSQLTLDFSLLSPGNSPGAATLDAFWFSDQSWKIIDVGGNGGVTNFTTLVNGGPFTRGSFSTSIGTGVHEGDIFLNYEVEFFPLPGDVNFDGVVDIFDVNVVSDNWSETGPPGITGDANSDGVVDIFDVNVISDNWGATGTAIVPEPSTLSICLFVLAAATVVRRRGC